MTSYDENALKPIARRSAALLGLLAGFFAMNTPGASTLFSLDLGSDKEISDPFGGGGGEGLDPGDLYQRSAVVGSTVTPWLDDVTVFGGFDPRPVTGVPASACLPGSGNFAVCFDLDGTDNIDFRLSNIDLGNYIDANAVGPTQCVETGQYLVISLDDDGPEGMEEAVGPRAPTEDAPDHGLASDEVFGVTRATGSVSWAPIADEISVHVDLGPNPIAQGEDDDVDALDIVKSEDCHTHLFSADDEARLSATLGLNPGSIYEHTAGVAGAPIEVITFMDLGTTPITDIDAFELAWLPVPQTNQQALALLFSVDQDRPSTGGDESGGLNPGTIYASFLNGSHFIYIPAAALPFGDVDALAATDTDQVNAADADGDGVADNMDNCIVVANPDQHDGNNDGIGNICDPDFDDDCDVGFPDLVLFRSVFFTANFEYDLDSDGTVGFSDLAILKRYFFSPPGPSAFACL